MKLVTVYRTFSSADAQLILSLLEANDIPGMIADELSSLSLDGYSMATGGIRVQVPEEEVENARVLIESKGTSVPETPAEPADGNGSE
jgi:hypothetical protein